MTHVATCERCNSQVTLDELDAWRSEPDGDYPACRNYVRRGHCGCGAIVELGTTWHVPSSRQAAEAH